jgi:hypothetical protein
MAIDPSSLLVGQAYEHHRRRHRPVLMAHRRARSLALGPHALLQFEDELTVRYQIQEALRAERVTDPLQIGAEIAPYERWLPDARNWKASLLLQFAGEEERRRMRPHFCAIARAVHLHVAGCPQVTAHANEDLDPRDVRPSATHFLRFELPPQVRSALRQGSPARVLCTHPAYRARVALEEPLRQRLLHDLTSGTAAAPLRCQMAIEGQLARPPFLYRPVDNANATN